MPDTVQPIPDLGWREMTRRVTVIRRPNRLLRSLCISREELLGGETVDLMKIFRGRRAAPMITRDGPAQLIPNQGEIHGTVVTPNIALKKAFDSPDLLYTRRGGSAIYASDQERAAARGEYITRELGELEDQIQNREEWMVAQALTGQITYAVDGGAHFTVTYPKSGSMTVALTGTDAWDDAAATPIQDIMDAKIAMEAACSLQPDVAILSASAGAALLAHAATRTILDQQNVQAGNITFERDIDMNGALFIGVLAGVSLWMYTRTVDVPNGDGTYTTENLIRDKYVEFISTSAAAECWMYYGAIADLATIGPGRSARLKRFSKSWEQQDPSARIFTVKSRPLCVPRHPDFVYSLKVLE